MVEHLPSKHKALGSVLSSGKKKKTKKTLADTSKSMVTQVTLFKDIKVIKNKNKTKQKTRKVTNAEVDLLSWLAVLLWISIS